MARVTVEDCVLKIPNRFELVLLSSQRAREIGAGSPLMVDRDNDKNPVVSLREIADTDISLENLKEALIKNHQKVIEVEEDEEDIIDMMDGEAEWAQVAQESAETEIETAGLHEGVEENAVVEETAGEETASEEAYGTGAEDTGAEEENPTV